MLTVAELKEHKAATFAAAVAEARHVAAEKKLDARMTEAVVAAVVVPVVGFLTPHHVHFLADDAAAVLAAAPDVAEERGAVDGAKHAAVDRRDWNAALAAIQAAGHVVSVTEIED